MKLISRKTALKDQDFASFISSWQQIGNPADDVYMKEEGEYFDDDLKADRFFSQPELDELYRKNLDEFENIIDDVPIVKSKLLGKIVIDAPENSNSIEFWTETLTRFFELHKLKLIFVPLYKTSWFDEENIKHHHRTTQKAYKKFKDLVGVHDYSGGIIISSSLKLKEFLPLYFMLVKSNFYTDNFFYSEDLKTVFSFHYSGQLWFYCFSKNGLKMISGFVDEYNLKVNNEFSTF